MPGPGMYDKPSSPGKSYTFGKEQSPGVGSLAPGPGAYDAKDEMVRSGSKQTKIGSAKRGTFVPTQIDEEPGPGMYNVEDKKGGGFTFGKEQPSHIDVNVPGPGAYDAKDSLVKSGSK